MLRTQLLDFDPLLFDRTGREGRTRPKYISPREDCPHGTIGGYRNWKCRCYDCTRAERDHLYQFARAAAESDPSW